MISVAEALARVLADIAPLPPEQVSLADAFGRVLARPVVARRTQPPLAVSAMDGWAVRAADVAGAEAARPARLRRIGAVAAGGLFEGRVGPGEAVRIFTGAAVPDGADAIVIQEDTDTDGAAVLVREGAPVGRYVRAAGLDFRAGDEGLPAGCRLTARDVSLAAAMNAPWLDVARRPRVALLATGDEIVMPGEPVGPTQIVGSTGLGLAGFVRACGGEPTLLPIARDNDASLQESAASAAGADVLVTLGGASVGEHDLVRSALGAHGLELDFWQIAMRPGKPLMHGRFRGARVLGLPGNPVSGMVCALLFLRPILLRLQGIADVSLPRVEAVLGADLPANDRREDYLRGTLSRTEGRLVASAFSVQDSSMLSRLARATCLIVRAPNAAAAPAGTPVEAIPLDHAGAVL